eukprot:PLAT11587.1.p3 GENE.PLAT11587.1~~PLAT11587.1.p3  ORF type:complete len:507 (-),score=269.42 PLAT11587.1:2069-3589(-)
MLHAQIAPLMEQALVLYKQMNAFDPLEPVLGPAQQALANLAEEVSFPVDQLKFVIVVLLGYVFAIIHRSLGNRPALKHVVSLLGGFLTGWFCMAGLMAHSLVSALVVYTLVYILRGRSMPYIVFAITMLYLLANHMERQWNAYGAWNLDHTGPQMVLTIKLTAFAFNVQDGRDLADSKRAEKMSAAHKARALRKMPSLLEFLGFVYFFGAFHAGPAFEMSEYLAVTNLTAFNKLGKKRSVTHPPSSVLPALSRVLQALLCIAIMMKATAFFSIDFLATDEFYAMPLFQRVYYVWFAVALTRHKYYFGWKLAEGSCILAGFGFRYDEDSKKISWDGVSNVNILGVELATNMKGVTDSWNSCTGAWLYNYIYTRVPFGKGVASLCTYTMSAVWHGFYPGYYITFISGAAITTLARHLRRRLRFRFVTKKDGKEVAKPTKMVYDFITWIGTSFALNYITMPFLLLDLPRSWGTLVSTNFAGYLLLLALLPLLFILKGDPSKRKSKKKSS